MLVPPRAAKTTPALGIDSQIHVSAYGLANTMNGRMNNHPGVEDRRVNPDEVLTPKTERDGPPASILQIMRSEP